MRTSKSTAGGCLAAAAMLVWAAPVLAQPFELAVERDGLFGGSAGRLIVELERVEYATNDVDDARIWAYVDIKQIQVRSPTEVTIKTYEDQGWTRLGADRSFAFTLTEGTVSPALAAFLARRVDRPLVLAVSPLMEADARFRIPVKLRQRLRGSDGVLAVYDDHVAYETDRANHARYWRDVDLYAVFQPDRYRLTLEVYEGGGDDRRAFSFDLKQTLPAGFLDLLWRRLHTPDPARIGSRGETP